MLECLSYKCSLRSKRIDTFCCCFEFALSLGSEVSVKVCKLYTVHELGNHKMVGKFKKCMD